MSHTKHHHPHSKSHDVPRDSKNPYWTRAHLDWKFWIAISLMLTAMLVYVVTVDLSVQPNDQAGPKIQQPTP